MPYSPYEWNETVRQRNEYIEERLREGAPVVAVSYDDGILLLTIRRSQRKIYEIYDKLMFSAIGNQSDIEAIRTGAIDIAHREGFSRSPDDVSIQRIVGFAVSPSIKKVYSDPFASPVAVRAIFAELGDNADKDQFFIVGYDGEFAKFPRRAVIGGSTEDEQRMLDELDRQLGEKAIGKMASLEATTQAALHAWAAGRMEPAERDPLDERFTESKTDPKDLIREAFALGGELEAAVLERSSKRENRFRMLTSIELESIKSTIKA
jgi:proteasome alpha subunit